MLSLDKGFPIFHLLSKSSNDDGKGPKGLKTRKIKKHTIKYNEGDVDKKSDIQLEDGEIAKLFDDSDYKKLKRKFHLNQWQVNSVKKALKKPNCGKDSCDNGLIYECICHMEDMADDILKHSLTFDDAEYKNDNLIPAIKPNGFGVISIVGPSGAGKSTVAAEIIRTNMRRTPALEDEEIEEKLAKMTKKEKKKFLMRNKDTQKIFLLSRQVSGKIDPALEDLEKYIIHLNPSQGIEGLPELEDMEGSFVLIDDIEGLPNAQKEIVMEMVNMIATCGRKLAIKLIYSTHMLKGWVSRYIIAESQVVVFFPRSNSFLLKDLLRLKYCLKTSVINKILTNVKRDGSRVLFLRTNYPFCYATSKRVFVF